MDIQTMSMDELAAERRNLLSEIEGARASAVGYSHTAPGSRYSRGADERLDSLRVENERRIREIEAEMRSYRFR